MYYIAIKENDIRLPSGLLYRSSPGKIFKVTEFEDVYFLEYNKYISLPFKKDDFEENFILLKDYKKQQLKKKLKRIGYSNLHDN